jgi:hypothetical protein
LAEGDFPSETVQELRELLGSKFNAASPWLEVAAAFYVAAKTMNVSAKVRREIERLIDLLRKVEDATERLSPDAVALLGKLNDLKATNGIEPFVTIHHSLVQVSRACGRASDAVGIACDRVDSPGTVLAVSVASALALAEVPISKGRDGLFARVLTVVWHGVDSDSVPEEISRYVRAAADQVLPSYPALRPPKGRPTGSHKRSQYPRNR